MYCRSKNEHSCIKLLIPKSLLISMSISISILMHPHSNKKIATVPKGFLKFYILKLLDEGPKSGSEIVQEIDIRTEGLWKPSPGSIYPLLSRLNNKGFIQRIENGDTGIKRYEITKDGQIIYKEMLADREETRMKGAILNPIFIGSFEHGDHPPEIIEFNRSMDNLLKAYWHILDALRERYSYDTVKEATCTIDQAIRTISKLENELETKYDIDQFCEGLP